MVNYGNTIIYKLCCKNTDISDEYIGSTTNFSRRKTQHKHSCNKESNKDNKSRVYEFIRLNGGWDNWQMVEVERYEATDRKDMCKRERYWMEQLKSSLNCKSSFRTSEENSQIEKQWAIGYNKKYRTQNKDRIKEVQKFYLENNRNKVYERQNKWRRQKRTCECGVIMNIGSLAKHQKSPKHIKAVEKLRENTVNIFCKNFNDKNQVVA